MSRYHLPIKDCLQSLKCVELVVADLCVCEGFAAPPGAAALRLRWQPGFA